VKKSEKVDICLPFLGKKKKLCPCALTLKRKMHQKGQSFINFFQKSSRHTISKGTRNFPKRQRKKSRMVEGRSLHSVPLAFWSISQKSQFVPSGATGKFCDIA